jgi:hypothetical protein
VRVCLHHHASAENAATALIASHYSKCNEKRSLFTSFALCVKCEAPSVKKIAAHYLLMGHSGARCEGCILLRKQSDIKNCILILNVVLFLIRAEILNCV